MLSGSGATSFLSISGLFNISGSCPVAKTAILAFSGGLSVFRYD